FDAELLKSFGSGRNANQAAAVFGHEIDRSRGDRLRCHNQITFILAIGIVHNDDHAASLKIGTDRINAVELACHHSDFGKEPRTFTKLQCSLSSRIAFSTFKSFICPSQSTKKKYSQAFLLLGRDSILVMLIRNRRNGANARYKAPTSSTMLNMRLVRS